jgi:hypothetical protein
MINSILKFPVPYRFYQKSVRSKFDEYNFINFIFSEIKNKKNIRVLDCLKERLNVSLFFA